MIHHHIMRNSLEHEDFLEIYPLDGRKKLFPLKRTRIEINHFPQIKERFSAQTFNLRNIESKKGQYSLSLEKYLDNQVYRLRSLNGEPFLHNGNVTFECLLRRGDNLEIGYYRMKCCSKKETESSNKLPIQKWPQGMFILLEGETGTGKTSLAEKLHHEFVGEHLPFVAINLSAFSAGLLESELFGHEKGAFTGAVREKRGAIEQAREGTLFIDELDSLPKYLQIKILTFLDDKKFRRVGGEREKQGKCHLVFSSGRPLDGLVKDEKFRQDLFYRVSSGIKIKLPPLRRRKKLIQRYLNEFESARGVTLSMELRDFLMSYEWPGNYRQLKGHLQRKLYLSEGRSLLKLDECEFELLNKKNDIINEEDGVIPLDELKRNYCKRILLKNGGRCDITSKQLKIAKSTLRRLTAA